MGKGATAMAVLAAAAVLALGLAACGGGSSSLASGVSTTIHVPPKPKTTSKEAATADERGRTTGAKAPPPEAVVGAVCPGKVGVFISALEGLRRELEVGLSYEQYAAEIDTIRKLYGHIPVKKLTLSCLSATGTPGERAFDRYVAAANTWNACAAEPSCGSSRIEAGLQKEWRVAAHFLKEAKRGLS
jgi:hypothetical protein